MKKVILIIILLVAAAIPAVPYYIGTTVEQTFRAEIEDGAREAALSGFEIELVDYQRQLFNATAITRLSLIVPEGEEKLAVELHHRIDHTPQLSSRVIATVNSEMVLDEGAQQAISSLFNGQAPFTGYTRIFLDGHQEVTLNSPAAAGEIIADGESVAIEWQGLQGKAWQSAARDHVTFELQSAGIVVTPRQQQAQAAPAANGTMNLPATAQEENPAEAATTTVATPSADNGENDEAAAVLAEAESVDKEFASPAPQGQLESLSLTQLSYTGDMHKAESGMWQGKASGTLASLDINGTDESAMPVAMHFDTIALNGEQSESNGLMQLGGAFSAKSINVNGFALSNAVYDISMENIDSGTVRAWQQTAQQIMKGEISQDDPFAPMLQHLPALFNAHPVLKINDLSVDSPLGRFALKMDASTQGEWSDALLQNPLMFATMLNANIDASVPRNIVVSALQEKMRNAILAQAAISEVEMSDEELQNAVTRSVNQQLGGLIGQGYIKENAAQLETSVAYNAGQLTVNGMDASGLMGVMMP